MARPFLFVINSLAPGGAERSLVELLPRLREAGVEPVVVCLYERGEGFEKEVRTGGFDLRFLQARRFPSRVLELRRMIQADRPRLLHTTLFEADIVGRFAAIGSEVPVVSTLANTTYDPVRLKADANLNPVKVAVVRWIDAWTSRHLTDHFHAVSGAVKDQSVIALKIEPEAVTVVHRGRDPVRLGMRTEERRALVRNGLGLDAGTELILTVGRNEFQKGQEYLIRAFAETARLHPHSILAIAGRNGNATDSIKSLAKSLDVADRVLFLGHRRDVPDLLAAADLFVFPSLWEGLGGAVIEALALETPIVASDLPAVREVVVNGENGILVPPGDAPVIAAAMLRMLDAPPRDRLVSGNRARFESMFSGDVNARLMLDLLMGQALSVSSPQP